MNFIPWFHLRIERIFYGYVHHNLWFRALGQIYCNECFYRLLFTIKDMVMLDLTLNILENFGPLQCMYQEMSGETEPLDFHSFILYDVSRMNVLFWYLVPNVAGIITWLIPDTPDTIRHEKDIHPRNIVEVENETGKSRKVVFSVHYLLDLTSNILRLWIVI